MLYYLTFEFYQRAAASNSHTRSKAKNKVPLKSVDTNKETAKTKRKEKHESHKVRSSKKSKSKSKHSTSKSKKSKSQKKHEHKKVPTKKSLKRHATDATDAVSSNDVKPDAMPPLKSSKSLPSVTAELDIKSSKSITWADKIPVSKAPALSSTDDLMPVNSSQMSLADALGHNKKSQTNTNQTKHNSFFPGMQMSFDNDTIANEPTSNIDSIFADSMKLPAGRSETSINTCTQFQRQTIDHEQENDIYSTSNLSSARVTHGNISQKELSKKVHKKHNKPIKCVTHTPHTEGSLQWQIAWDAIEMESISGENGVIRSIPFEVGGHTWTIELFPNSNANKLAQFKQMQHEMENNTIEQDQLQQSDGYSDVASNNENINISNIKHNTRNNGKPPIFSTIANSISRASLPLPINKNNINSRTTGDNQSEKVSLLQQTNGQLSSYATPARSRYQPKQNIDNRNSLIHSQPRQTFGKIQQSSNKLISSNKKLNQRKLNIPKQQAKFHLYVHSNMTPFRAKIAVYYAKLSKKRIQAQSNGKQQHSSAARSTHSHNQNNNLNDCSGDSESSVTDDECNNNSKSSSRSNKGKLKWFPIYVTKIIKFEENGAFCDKIVDFNILSSLVYRKKIRLRIVVKVFDGIQTQCLNSMTATQLLRENLENQGLLIQEPESRINDTISKLLKSGMFADTLLIVQNTDNSETESKENIENILQSDENNVHDTVTIQAHSCVLGSFSTKFEQMIIAEKLRMNQINKQKNWGYESTIKKQHSMIKKMKKNIQELQTANTNEEPIIELEKRDDNEKKQPDIDQVDIQSVTINPNFDVSNQTIQKQDEADNDTEPAIGNQSVNITVFANDNDNNNELIMDDHFDTVSPNHSTVEDTSVNSQPSTVLNSPLPLNASESVRNLSQVSDTQSQSNSNSIECSSIETRFVEDMIANFDTINVNVNGNSNNNNDNCQNEVDNRIVLNLGTQWRCDLVQLLLKYMYCEEIPLFSETNYNNPNVKSVEQIRNILTENTTLLFELMQIADYFEIQRLVLLCLQRLSMILDTLGANMLHILVWTEKYAFLDGISQLEDQCLRYLVANLAVK